ncbi:MAG TPA: S-layer homology domain-containing protein, partial [Epulopiscium sp.]|nr:S-layer homology domain-containing protein [Candidatus Epulonipiscium sp.]
MKKTRKFLARSIALVTGMVMMATTTLFASPMKDVPTNHWAYSEIMEMQKRGLLVTSSQGEFFPNNYVTYFEFSQILAKATGYQDAKINPNIDPALKKAIDSNYEKQKATIEAQQKNYKYWQKEANGEIAYLLGKGYLQKEELGKFMSTSTSGEESKRGVRKQEAAIYLVRILHKAETAKDEYVSTGFTDEAKMEAASRPYIAYMKKIGIVHGNPKGEFGPTEPITRATLSKMLMDALKVKEGSVTTPTTPTTPKEPTNPTQPSLPTDKALEGKFTKMISKGTQGYYVVLEVEPGKTHTYSIETTASVVDKNGIAISLSDLKSKIDTKGDRDVVVTSQVEMIGTTEYITKVKILDGPDNLTPPVIQKPEEEKPERPVRPQEPTRPE